MHYIVIRKKINKRVISCMLIRYTTRIGENNHNLFCSSNAKFVANCCLLQLYYKFLVLSIGSSLIRFL